VALIVQLQVQGIQIEVVRLIIQLLKLRLKYDFGSRPKSKKEKDLKKMQRELKESLKEETKLNLRKKKRKKEVLLSLLEMV
jgi:hypothetical protein